MTALEALRRLMAIHARYTALLVRIMTGELSLLDPKTRALVAIVKGERTILSAFITMASAEAILGLPTTGSEYAAIADIFEAFLAQDEVLVISLEMEYLLTELSILAFLTAP